MDCSHQASHYTEFLMQHLCHRRKTVRCARCIEITLCFEGSSVSSFTPRHTVTSGSFAGADIITHFAPASRCFEADALSVNLPVDSRTTSTPRLFHGSFSGSVTARIFISFPLTLIPLSVTFTSALNIPCTESYLSRCARVFASVRSFIATISKSLQDAGP